MEERNIYNREFDEKDYLSYYTEMEDRLSLESQNFDFVMEHMPPTYTNTDKYIREYVSNFSKEELHSRADALIKAQNLQKNNDIMEHMTAKGRGNFNHFRAQWSPIIWQTHEVEETQKIKIGDKVVDGHDFDFSIAQSIELQDANCDPTTEYHDWIKTQNEIETDINTLGTTLSEIEARNTFIAFMDMRETEIKRIATLYSGSALNPNSPFQEIAQEKLKFTLFKLSELRRLRDRMQTTKSTPDNFKSLPQHVQKKELALLSKRLSHNKNIIPQDEEEQENSSNFSFDSIGEQRLCNNLSDPTLTQGVGDMFLDIKPTPQNVEECNIKIDTISANHKHMIEILKAMRQGMSKEEFIKKQNCHKHPHKLRAFDIASYNQALRELNA